MEYGKLGNTDIEVSKIMCGLHEFWESWNHA